MVPSAKAPAPAQASSGAGDSLCGCGPSGGRAAGEAPFAGGSLSGGWGRGRCSRERGRRCSRGLCSALEDLGDRDLCFLLSREPRLSRGRSRLLSLGWRGLQALSRLLGGEQPRPRGLDPDRRRRLRLLSWCSWEEPPGLPDRERDLRRPGPRKPLLLSLPLSLAFFRLARSWLLEHSLEDLRLRALGCCLLALSSPTGGDTDPELPSPEREPERVPERVLLGSLAGARFLLASFLPRELDVERERERGWACNSTALWVGGAGGGTSGSVPVTQVTVRSSALKKELWSGGSSSSQGPGGDGLCARAAGPRPSGGPSSSGSLSTSKEGP